MMKKNTRLLRKKSNMQSNSDDDYIPYDHPDKAFYDFNDLDYDELSKKKKTNKPKTTKEKFYVDPKMFDLEIVNFYENGKVSDELADMISKIANKLSFSSNFAGYTYREEMVGDGIVRMFKALMSKKYNRSKGTNPFSYFTRIAFNAFRNRIKKEKTIHEAQEKYQQEYMIMSEGYSNLLKNNQTKITKDLNGFDYD